MVGEMVFAWLGEGFLGHGAGCEWLFTLRRRLNTLALPSMKNRREKHVLRNRVKKRMKTLWSGYAFPV